MAEEKKTPTREEIQAKMQAGRVAGAPRTEETTAPPVTGAPAPTTNTAPKTAEFTDNKEDPTWPSPEKKGVVVIAEEPFKRETFDDDGETVEILWYRVRKDGEVTEVPYEQGVGKKLTESGHKKILEANRAAIEKAESSMATLAATKGGKMKLMQFMQKFSRSVGVVTNNDVAPELATVTVKDDNASTTQRRYRTLIREKSPGGIREHLVTVPARAYELLDSGDAFSEETLNEILAETAPEMKFLALHKDAFPIFLLNFIGGSLQVIPPVYDRNTAKYPSLSDIPSIYGMPAGAELLYFTLDEKKIALNTPVPTQKPSETTEAFDKRMANYNASKERGTAYRSGGMSLRDKASIIKIRNNVRSSLVSASNFIPFRTFNTTAIGQRMEASQAREMNSRYMRTMELNTAIQHASEASKLRKVDNKIEESIYFPASENLVNKIEPIKHFFRQRSKEDGVPEKVSFTPNRVIAKKIVVDKNGEPKPVNDSVAINEDGYSDSRLRGLQSRYIAYMNTLPASMHCPFVSVDEIVATNKKPRSSGAAAVKISSSRTDAMLLKQDLLMMDMALGNGDIVISAMDAKREINAVKASDVVAVSNRRRADLDKIRKLQSVLASK